MIETETVAETEKPAPVTPLQRHQHIETDTFCAGCGYNLHGQPITRDERLDIRVCRCPECGKFHPAGRESTAASLWLSRVATLALGFWILVILFALFWLVIGMGAVMVVHLEEFSYRRMVAADGREVEWGNTGRGNMLVDKGTTQPAHGNITRTVRSLDPAHDWRRQHYQNEEWRRQQMLIGSVILGLSDLGLGFVGGVLLVVFFWHWSKRRYPLVMLLPFAVAAVVLAVTLMEDEYEFIRGWAISRALMHAALQAAFMYAGIKLGRPIARGLLRMFIPPRPRQVFAFLWRADGKTPPGAVG